MAVFLQERYRDYPGIENAEVPERIDRIVSELTSWKVVKLDREKSVNAILQVHTKRYLDELFALAESRAVFPDVFFCKELIDVMLNAVNTVLVARKNQGFAVIRPPGHHAQKEHFAGFCYVNNAVIACYESIKRGEKVAILDIDSHYGDGTHSLIMNYKNVRYYSVHADTKKYYPNKEHSSTNAYLINVDPQKTDDESYFSDVERLIEYIRVFEPDLLCVSVGFDTFFTDPIQGFAVSNPKTYHKIGKLVRTIDAEQFCVLEGGYSKELGILVKNFLHGWDV